MGVPEGSWVLRMRSKGDKKISQWYGEGSFLGVCWLVLRSEGGVIQIPVLGPLLAWLLAQEAKHLTVEVGKFLAYRALFIVVLWTLGPLAIFQSLRIIFSYIVPFILTQMSSVMSSQLGSNPEPQIVELYGVGAWIASLMKLSQGITIFLTWLVMKFTWKMLPKPMGIGR
jgi:hypothetical protein